MLKLMYITNNIEVAQIAQEAGVDRIFVDLEILGKQARQGNLDSVKSHHTVADILKLRPYVSKGALLVRINPINIESQKEIDSVIQNGADIIMLPMYKTVNEVKQFIEMVQGRAKTILLLETKEAHQILDKVLEIMGIDEIHIGLNDLHLSYRKKFMFELLIDGTVENICNQICCKDIPYGFGGVAALGSGNLPAEEILCEHYRLKSSMVILSRSFCNVEKEHSIADIKQKFVTGVTAIRKYENVLKTYTNSDFEKNHDELTKHIREIVKYV